VELPVENGKLVRTGAVVALALETQPQRELQHVGLEDGGRDEARGRGAVADGQAGIAPAELLERGREEVRAYGVEVVSDTVVS